MAGDTAMSESVRLSKLQASIQGIIAFCAENELEIPSHIKHSLLVEAQLEEVQGNPGVLTVKDHLQEITPEETVECISLTEEITALMKKLKAEPPHFDLRVKDGSYTVTQYYKEDVFAKKGEEGKASDSNRAKQKIQTVTNQSPFYKLFTCLVGCVKNKGDIKQKKVEKVIMDGVNLTFEPGKMYLVLGAPGSGKSTLLKMIADNLHKSKDHVVGGKVSLTGVSPAKGVIWTNLVSYIDQIDRLHPFLTVFETCKFAWLCRTGGTHRKHVHGQGEEVDETIKKLDDEMFLVNKILEAVGLTRVKDTFVGGEGVVRGVSGGEKKRVTVAEMLCIGTPVICCDEISTGLDAATTFDITRLLGDATRVLRVMKIVSLLQPPPETVANFDELILLGDGKIIYSGPVNEVIDYFNSLGYEIPERMDVADWLQALPTKDGYMYLNEASGGDVDKAQLIKKHLSSDEFRDKFYASVRGREILERVGAPVGDGGDKVREIAEKKFVNSWSRSLKLLVRRELRLWWRDKYQIKAKLAQAVIQAIIVGTLFWQANEVGIVSVLFQSMLTTVIGAMLLVVKQFPLRSIFYKQQDANFYPTWTYVVGRSVANIPSALIDSFLYGTIVFFFSGLAVNDGASVVNYIVFVLSLFVLSLTTGLFFSMYSAAVENISIAQAAMSVTTVVLMLFCGFTVQPDVIPDYYIWIYWINMLAWILRGLVVNEFDSGRYDELLNITSSDGQITTITEGEATIIRFGFVDSDDEAYTFEWAGWGILVTLLWTIIAVLGSTYFLSTIRFATGGSLVTEQGDNDEDEEIDGADMVAIPFKRVDLTFKDIHYTVKASTSDEKLELLKGINGVVEAGRMTALMGSSGAGKTTLMDVLAMRKSSGEIEGEIRLNGHTQEEISFRRCTGYVEQFDTQSPQLTIRETVEFSAKMRLEETAPAVTPESITKFVDQTLKTLELTNLQDLQVGSDAGGGLSFEQKKRLSIAVEVAANPSVLFLDEPTSGLDARAASIVMKGMKQIALSGRAVCATIHQPSVAIFDSFDSLLLLKRGGETIFFGDLGEESHNLIQYLERYDATPKIQPGENPATWMLTTIGAGSAANVKPFDYAGSYSQSKLRSKCIERIDKICADASEDERVSFPRKYATSRRTQGVAVMHRAMTIYFRSPSYNVIRLLVSVIVAVLFGTVYASQRVPENESDMNSRINSLFIAVIFLAVNAQNSVLSVFEVERNMFYRHRAALMYDSSAIARALTVAEIPFIFMASSIFVVLFYFIMGFANDAGKFFYFFMFFTFSLMVYTYIGQMLMSLFRDSETAQGVGGLFVSVSALFSGILLRSDFIPTFWVFMYWITPGHYIFEGIIMSQYDNDDTPIIASAGSAFYSTLNCQPEVPCIGTAGAWVTSSFPEWDVDHLFYDALYMIALIFVTRLITFFALTNLDYRSN